MDIKKEYEYELLTGNQTGMLLLDYICSQRVKHGKMPANPVMVKTIVTMDMGEQIATHYGLRTINGNHEIESDWKGLSVGWHPTPGRIRKANRFDPVGGDMGMLCTSGWSQLCGEWNL